MLPLTPAWLKSRRGIFGSLVRSKQFFMGEEDFSKGFGRLRIVNTQTKIALTHWATNKKKI
jgi:hypothetical protein